MVKLSFGLVFAAVAVQAVQAGNPNSLRGTTTGSVIQENNDDDLKVNLLDVVDSQSNDGSKDIYFDLKDWAKTLSRKYTPEQFIAKLDNSDTGSLGLQFDQQDITTSASRDVMDALGKRLSSGRPIDMRNFFGSGDGQVRLKDFVDAMDASDDDDGSDLELNLTDALSIDSDAGSKDIYYNIKDWIKTIRKKMTLKEFLYKLAHEDSSKMGLDLAIDPSDLTSSGSGDMSEDFLQLMRDASRSSHDMGDFIGSGKGKVSLKSFVDAFDASFDDSEASADEGEAESTKGEKPTK